MTLYKCHVSTIYSFAQAKALQYQISDLKKNLTICKSRAHMEDFCVHMENSHAHVHMEDDQKGFHQNVIRT